MSGYAKTDAYEGIERAGNRRIRGIAAQTLPTFGVDATPIATLARGVYAKDALNL